MRDGRVLRIFGLSICSITCGFLCFVIGSAGCRAPQRDRVAASRSAADRAPLTEEQRQQNVESFDYVWRTVREKHWDPELGGLDWEAVRDELRPKVQEAQNMREARVLMQDMISRLKQSHFGIIPASVYRDVDVNADDDDDSSPSPGRRRGEGTAGLDVRIIDGQAVVNRVEPNLPAAEAGVQPGWVIEKVEDRRIDRMIRTVSEHLSESDMLEAMLASAIASRLRGDIDDTVNVTFLNEKDRPVKKTFNLMRPAGTKANFGHLPTFYVTFRHERLPSNIGYITFSAFFDPQSIMQKFGSAMNEFRDTDGMIIDLRGNPGGIGAMAMGIGGYFVSEPNQRLGTMTARTGTIHFILNRRPSAYKAPLAILVDELSMSTSEILAGGLQDLGRARVFGSPTPGAALPSIVERLPNGDGFQYAFANYTSTGGEVLEGRGVTPDEVVPLDRAALLAGRDPVIEAAVRWIESQRRPRTASQSH